PDKGTSSQAEGRRRTIVRAFAHGLLLGSLRVCPFPASDRRRRYSRRDRYDHERLANRQDQPRRITVFRCARDSADRADLLNSFEDRGMEIDATQSEWSDE